MKKLFLLLLAVLMTGVCASAQNRTISGTVLSADNSEPLMGASVYAQGTSSGVTTDLDGKFTLSIPANVTKLTVSYVGYQSKVVEAKDGITVMLQPTTQLDEVMVVAYGTAKKSEYTGSASVVKADQLEDALVSSATSALAGRVAGVQVLSGNGQPGEQPTLMIRGVGSINASTQPLYVLDGMPYDGDISAINPQDIETMTILKDAAATSLYGARGANGVVQITTKKGKSGEAKITFDARWGINSRGIPSYDLITDQRQFMETVYQSLYNGALYYENRSPEDAYIQANNRLWTSLGYQTWSVPEGQYFIGKDGKFNPAATPGYQKGNYYYIADDWVKESIINGNRQEYNFSVSGGSDRIQYYVSAAYLDDEGIIYGSHFNRFSTRTTVDYQAKKWLKIGTNLSYTYVNSGYPDGQTDNSSGSDNLFGVVNQIGPIYPIYVRDANGNIMYNEQYNRPVYDYGKNSTDFSRNYMNDSNPAGALLYDKDDYLMDILDGKWYAKLTPLKGLDITGTIGLRLDNTREHMISNPYYGQSAPYGGSAAQLSSRTKSLMYQFLANYSFQLKDVHNFSVMLGAELDSYNYETIYASGNELYNPNSFVINNLDKSTVNAYGYAYDRNHRGFFGSFNYNYDGKYYAMLSYRRDASSRFHPDNRWGNFWSASIGWDLAKENWLRGNENVDLLKFKASFGQNGNDVLGSSIYYNYAYADQYQITGSDGVWSDGTLVYKGNKDITWEKSNNFNTGFDFSFWRGKLSGSAEYYLRQISDMLMRVPVSPSLGYPDNIIPMNVGSMRNSGIEIDLNYRALETKDYSWDINANITIPSNKVISLSESLKNEDGNWISGSRIYREGSSMYNMYLVKYAGVDPDNGHALYWTKVPVTDEQGKPVLDENDNQVYKEEKTDNYLDAQQTNRCATGNIMPKVYGGFGTTFKAYGVELSLSFSYQLGGRIYDNSYASAMWNGSSSYLGRAWHKDILNAWTENNRDTNVPFIASETNTPYQSSLSTRFLTSSNYLALNNIKIGYTFPQKWISKLYLSELQVYAAAENVALWSARKGLDPRMSYLSSSNTNYTARRVISGGVRVSF